MIQINCTQCKTLLTIDDAFAGGVCRCRHCGTIQTVPKHLRDQQAAGNGDVPGSPGGGVATATGAKTQKTLFQKKNVGGDGGGSSGTGLDDLANIVSSGLTSNRLKKSDGSSADGAAAKQNRKTVMIVAASGVIIAILVGVIIAMSMKDKTPPAIVSTGGGSSNSSAAQTGTSGGGTGVIPDNLSNPNATGGNPGGLSFKKIPAFLGQNIGEKSVIYVIDCGQAARSEGKFDLLRRAVVKSVQSLGEGRKFQVLLWAQGGKVQAFPGNGPAPASERNATDLAAWIDNVESGGQTLLSPALDRAFKAKPEAIMLVTVKAVLDDNFTPNIMKRRGDAKSNAKVYTFSLNQPELAASLKRAATETKGSYKDVSMGELKSAGD